MLTTPDILLTFLSVKLVYQEVSIPPSFWIQKSTRQTIFKPLIYNSPALCQFQPFLGPFLHLRFVITLSKIDLSHIRDQSQAIEGSTLINHLIFLLEKVNLKSLI